MYYFEIDPMSSPKITVRTNNLDKIIIRTPFFRRKHVKGTILKCMYNVPKDVFTLCEWKKIIDANSLVLKPEINARYAKKIEYPSFSITTDYVCLPREFGIKLLGKPEQDHSSQTSWQAENTHISWEFNGKLRPYQETACSALIEQGNGILCAGCGCGKTTMSIYAICQMKRKTIILLHKDFLLQQWLERLAEYAPGLRVGIIQQGKIQINDCDVVLAMIQTVISESKKDVCYDSFELCVIDECHHLCARTFVRSMRKIPCPRIGLSATLHRQDGLSYSILNEIGSVVCDIRRRVHCSVQIYKYAASDPLLLIPTVPYATLVTSLCEQESRNMLITNIVEKTYSEDARRVILVISSRKSLLREIHRLLIQNGFPGQDVGYYMGCTNKKQKKERDETEKKRVILGTSGVCSEGLDIKRLNTVLLATPCKEITQITGRIMRGGSQLVPRIIDISDEYNFIFKSMFMKRMRQYKMQHYDIHQKTVLQKK